MKSEDLTNLFNSAHSGKRPDIVRVNKGRYMRPWQRYEDIQCAYCGEKPDKCNRFGNKTTCK